MMMIENLLQRADKAVIKNDIVTMLRIFEEMKEVAE